MIVADTCIIVYLFNETDLTHQAVQVLEADPEWIVPPIWREEYANVIAKMAKTHKVKDAGVIKHFQSTLEQIIPGERAVDVQDALKMALKMEISVYDAYFIALAKAENSIVVTEDRDLIKKCPGIAVSMKEFIRNKCVAKSSLSG